MKQAVAIVAALASMPAVAGFNNTPTASVPVMDTVGLVAMAAVIGIAGLLVARRSK